MATSSILSFRIRSQAILAASVALAALGSVRPVVAQSASTWVGGTSSNWATAANWSNGVPVAEADFTSASPTNQPKISAATSVDTISISSGITGTISASGSNALTVGTVIYDYGSNFTISSNFVSGASFLLEGAAASTLLVSGSFSDTGGNGYQILGTNLQLSGADNVTGTVTLTNGSLLTLSGQASVTHNVVLSSSADALALNAVATYSGVISGAGNLTTSGAVTMTGANTYTGTTTISGSTLTLGNGSVSGSLSSSSAITDNGTLAFHQSAGMVFSNTITGTGGVTVISSPSGAIVLSGDNTYTGPTLVTGGSITAGYNSAGSDGSFGINSAVTVQSGGGLAVNTGVRVAIGSLAGAGLVFLDATNSLLVTGGLNTTATFGGTLSGPGNIEFTGTGTANILGTNSLTGTVTIDSGAHVTLGNGVVSSQFSSASGVVDNGTYTYNGTSSSPTTLAAPISGSGNVALQGGNLTLSGANTFSGGLTIGASATLIAANSSGSANGTAPVTVAGVLQIGTGATGAGSVSGAIVDNGFVQFNRADAYSSGAISGSGTVEQVGNGTTTMTGTSTYTGPTQIVAGTLTDGVAGAFSTGSVITYSTSNANLIVAHNESVPYVTTTVGGGLSLSSGATLTETNPTAASVYFSGNIAGAGALSLGGSGFYSFYGTNTYSGGTTITGSGTVAVANSSGSGLGSGSVTVGSGASLLIGSGGTSGSITNNVTDNGTVSFYRTDNPTYSGIISGSGSVTQNGTGTQTLSGANTYTGGTTVTAGALELTNTSGNATGTGLVTINSGAQLILGNGGADGSVAGNIVDNGLLVLNRSGTIPYPGIISGTGSVSYSLAGTLILGGQNTYSGSTLISAGTITDGVGGAYSPNSLVALSSGATANVNYNEIVLGLNGSGSTVILNSGTTLTQNTTTANAFSGTISGSGNLVIGGIGSETLGGNNAFTGTTTIGNSATLYLLTPLTGGVVNSGTLTFVATSPLVYSGVISGSGAVTSIASALVTLTGANTYTGATNITAGTLRVGAVNSLPVNSAVTVSAGATLDLGFSQTFNSLTTALGSMVTLESGATLTGNYNGGGTTIQPAVISGPGSLTLSGVGTVDLTGASTYTGGTTINSGSFLEVGSGSTSGGSIVGNVQDNGSLIFNTQSLALGGTISGTGSVAQGVYGTPGGTTTLAGFNTYTGGTTVNAGTLVLANSGGSATGSGNVTINAGALSGTGSASGYVQFNSGGGVLPGISAPGTLSVGSAEFNGGSDFGFVINNAAGSMGSNWSLLSVNGPVLFAITPSSPFTINLITLTLSNVSGPMANFNPGQTYSWEIISTATGISGFNLASVTLNTSGVANAFTGTFGDSLVGNNLFVNYTPAVVPEPSTWALSATGLGALGLVALLKRRRLLGSRAA